MTVFCHAMSAFVELDSLLSDWSTESSFFNDPPSKRRFSKLSLMHRKESLCLPWNCVPFESSCPSKSSHLIINESSILVREEKKLMTQSFGNVWEREKLRLLRSHSLGGFLPVFPGTGLWMQTVSSTEDVKGLPRFHKLRNVLECSINQLVSMNLGRMFSRLNMCGWAV